MVLLNYWAAPTIGSLSQAELLMGRKLQTFIPTLLQNQYPLFSTDAHRQLLKHRQRAQHKYEDKHTWVLVTVKRQQPVWLKHKRFWQKGVIIQVGHEPRQYTVRTTSGAMCVAMFIWGHESKWLMVIVTLQKITTCGTFFDLQMQVTSSYELRLPTLILKQGTNGHHVTRAIGVPRWVNLQCIL